jgi:hypothetical protein
MFPHIKHSLTAISSKYPLGQEQVLETVSNTKVGAQTVQTKFDVHDKQ